MGEIRRNFAVDWTQRNVWNDKRSKESSNDSSKQHADENREFSKERKIHEDFPFPENNRVGVFFLRIHLE